MKFLSESGKDKTKPRPLWSPCLKFQVLNLRDREFLQDQIDVFNMLKTDSTLTSDLVRLDFLKGFESKIQSLIRWTGRNVHACKLLWDVVRSDIPYQLGEGLHDDPSNIYSHGKRAATDNGGPILSRHPRYRRTVLV